MYDPQQKWPLRLDGERLVVFIGLTLIGFVLLGTLDAAVARDVARLPAAIRDPFHIITRPGNSDWIFYPTILITAVCLLAALLVPKTNILRLRLHLIAALSGFVIAGVGVPGIIAALGKRIIGRARPVVFEEYGTLHFMPVNFDWRFQAFPSGDTTTVFALAAVVAFFFPRWKFWLLGGAALVGLARIMLSMHHPTDVLGGILLGTLGAFAVRNYYAKRGWLFKTNPDGTITPEITWPRSAD